MAPDQGGGGHRGLYSRTTFFFQGGNPALPPHSQISIFREFGRNGSLFASDDASSPWCKAFEEMSMLGNTATVAETISKGSGSDHQPYTVTIEPYQVIISYLRHLHDQGALK